MSKPVRVSPVDVRLRVVAIALEPALTLARIAALPLDDLQRLVTAGYFREARARGMSFRTIARRFDKSLRTITNMSRLANEQGLPLRTSDRITWRRRLVELAASRDGVSRDELLRAVPEADDEVLAEELDQLLGEGILEGDVVVRPAGRHLDMVQDELAARLDSVRHFLRSVTATVYRRFFVVDPDAEAFARVLQFTARRERLRALRSQTYETLREGAFEADAEGGDAHAMVAFCVVEAPEDPAWRAPKSR